MHRVADVRILRAAEEINDRTRVRRGGRARVHFTKGCANDGSGIKFFPQTFHGNLPVCSAYLCKYALSPDDLRD